MGVHMFFHMYKTIVRMNMYEPSSSFLPFLPAAVLSYSNFRLRFVA